MSVKEQSKEKKTSPDKKVSIDKKVSPDKKASIDKKVSPDVTEKKDLKEQNEQKTLTEKKALKNVTKKKTEKKVSSKKLPKILKKKYTEKKLTKKVLGKIYIDDDKKYVKNIFQKNEVVKRGKTKQFFLVPKETEFTRSEIIRFKKIAKQIKKQKGRIKVASLLIVIGLIAFIILGTDFACKFIMEKSLQSIFGAKASVGYVHLSYINSSFYASNIKVANKDKPMTNLFEFNSIVVDININELISKKVYIDEISALGFQYGTERKTSGALPVKETKKNESQTTENSSNEKTTSGTKLPSFDIKGKAVAFADEGCNRVVQTLKDTFSSYNPESILNDYFDNLRTPVVVKNIEQQLNTKIDKWKSVPDTLKTDISNFSQNVDKVVKTDINSVKTATDLKQYITDINNALSSAKTVQTKVSSTTSGFQSDSSEIKKMTDSLIAAKNADAKLAKEKINSITSFSFGKNNNILTQSIDLIISSFLGEYYPMVKQGIEYVVQIKENSDINVAKKESKKEKKAIERAIGRNVVWTKKETPKFYIGKISGSGSGLDVKCLNISSNPDLTGKPITFEGSYSIMKRVDSFNGSIDIRENSKAPLVSLSYKAPGVATNLPIINGTSDIIASVFAYDDYRFEVDGSVHMKPAVFTLASFQPEFAYALTNDVLNTINQVDMKISAGVNSKGKVSCKIDSDIDNKLLSGVSTVMNKQLGSVKSKAEAEIQATLAKLQQPIDEKLSEFKVIENSINQQKTVLTNRVSELESKKKEAENKLNATVNAAKEEVSDATKKAASEASDAAKDYLKKLF